MAEPLRMVVVAAEAGAMPAARTASAAVPMIAVCLSRATGYSSVRFGVGNAKVIRLSWARQWVEAQSGLAGLGHQPVSAGKDGWGGGGSRLWRPRPVDGARTPCFLALLRSNAPGGEVA
ncbi:hypothetical protein GCM10009727_63720 [Actinomadura napierensis]|uniref:Secreted protein n=1 Tax=Actinomadura napierensis TaxID=267854 RepID=A0ABN3A7J2_9ACTN